jgi:hypothetical protein
MCFVTRHQTNIQFKFSSLLNFLWRSPFNGDLSNKNSACKSCKFFLCSFKLRQLVLLCQANRYGNPARFFIGFLEFLRTFFAKAREFIEHILWEILKVIRAFGFFESDTRFRISHMKIKFRSNLNPSFVEKSFVQKWSKHFMKLKQVPNLTWWISLDLQ